jgi:hypothetical protein
MDPLNLTPPFSYSYQCASTLLVSYVPVYMYLVSLQFLPTFVVLVLLASSDLSIALLPEGLMKTCFPPIAWPLHLIKELNQSRSPSVPSVIATDRLIKPHQIVSNVVNNVILLLSFGLCSPVLGCYITLSTCATLWCWLMLIGRFVFRCTRLDLVADHHPNLLGPMSLQTEQNPISADSVSCAREIREEKGDEKPPNILPIGAALKCQSLSLLNQQLRGVSSSLTVCKWPVVLTSCLFVTLFSWDMVGDEVGWEAGLWVPVVGAMMLLLVWIWDRFLVPHVADLINRYNSPRAPLPPPKSSHASIEMVDPPQTSSHLFSM